MTNAEAREFEYALDCRSVPIRRALDRIDREQMRAELDRLLDAFSHDLVHADDFAF